MFRYYFLLSIVINVAFCQDCVTEDFENDVEANFTVSLCPRATYRHVMWETKEYSSANIKSPHPKSTRFVSPVRFFPSCMTSYKFRMTGGGIVEVRGIATTELDIGGRFSVDIWKYDEFWGSYTSFTGTGLSLRKGDKFGEILLRLRIPGSDSFVGVVSVYFISLVLTENR